MGIIPLGDHCAISMILKELNLREKSYPFDWVTKTTLTDTNIMYNIELIKRINNNENIDLLIENYFGNAFENISKINENTSIQFPHDTEDKNIIFEKYKRRFLRLKEDLNKKNIFIMLTRSYYIEQDIFERLTSELLNYHPENIIIFISGIDHPYFKSTPNIIFKYIPYDISQFYQYDYTSFRPNIKNFLYNLLISR